MRLPDFLVIGGMKCGSTTLYRDLMTSPDVFFPIDKEPGNLCHDEVLSPAGRAAYARLFEAAGPGQKCGEASTAYTKRPVHEGVAERALALLGPSLRVMYLVREPVSRIVSHHHHARTDGSMAGGLEESLTRYPDLLNFSRYATQVQPWIDALGPQRVRVLRFEDYTKRRRETTADLCAFIGAEARPGEVDEGAVFNRSDAKPVLRGPWRALVGSPLYQQTLRRVVGPAMRDRIRRLVLPKSRVEKAAVTAAVVDRVYDELAGELERLARIMGSAGPVWDRAAARARAEG